MDPEKFKKPRLSEREFTGLDPETATLETCFKALGMLFHAECRRCSAIRTIVAADYGDHVKVFIRPESQSDTQRQDYHFTCGLILGELGAALPESPDIEVPEGTLRGAMVDFPAVRFHSVKDLAKVINQLAERRDPQQPPFGLMSQLTELREAETAMAIG